MRGRLLALLLAGALLPRAGAAQAPDTAFAPAAVAAQAPASPPLPGDHWAVRAALRAEALGLAPGFLPAQRSAPRAAVAAALREAAGRAPVEAPALAPLAQGWWERFAEEFPESAGASTATAGLLGSAAGVESEGRVGAVAPGRGIFETREGTTPLPDEAALRGAAVLAGSLTPYLSGVAEPRAGSDGVRVPRWDVTAGWGALALSVGEEPVGYGPARGGGIVLSESAAFRRVQLQTTRPLALPGWLGLLGPVSAHAFLTRLSAPRHPGDPYLWGMRGALRPHPRFTVAVNRAAIFGGDSASFPLTPRNVGRMVLGLLTDGFENQVVAVEGRFRAPTEAVLPLTLYLEWGADDAAGGWWDVPGRVVGAHVPAVPGLPQLSLGAEYTYFAPPCCENPPWYLHLGYQGGWTAGDALLGHPVGGEGAEYLLYGGADLFRARLRLDGRAFLRERGREGYDLPWLRAGNLFAPERAGTSTGLALDGAWRVTPRAELRASGVLEAGRGWETGELAARVMILF